MSRRLLITFAVAMLARVCTGQQTTRELPVHLRPVSTPGLAVSVTVGIDDLRSDRMPTPILAVFDNQSELVIDGVWEIEQVDSADHESALVFFEPIQLAPPSTKVRRVCVTLANGRVAARLRHGRKVLWQAMLGAGTEQVPDEMHVLGVDPRGRRPGLSRLGRAPTNALQQVWTGVGCPMPPDASKTTVRANAVRPFQLPENAPPLHQFQAIAISEDCGENDFTVHQFQALGDYLLRGGQLVLPAEGAELGARIVERLPSQVRKGLGPDWFGADAEGQAVQMRRVGAGRMLVLARGHVSMFGVLSSGKAARAEVVRLLAAHPRPSFPRHVTQGFTYNQQLSPNSVNAMLFVLAVFGVYALLTGPAVVLLRRARHRVVAVYVLSTVGLFCVVALSVGGIIRLRRGNQEWMTVTLLTPDGGLQEGLLTLASAGGDRYACTVTGRHLRAAPLHVTPLDDDITYWSYTHMNGIWKPIIGGFHLTTPAVGPSEEIQEIALNVPITPWGQRTVLASAFWPQGRAIPISVDLDSEDQLVFTVTNTLPVSLRSVRILVGRWVGDVKMTNWPSAANFSMDVYWQYTLPTLARGASSGTKIPFASVTPTGGTWSSARSADLNWDKYPEHWQSVLWKHAMVGGPRIGGTSFIPPSVRSRDRLSAVLIGYVANSPSLATGDSDFDPLVGRHVIIQEIPSELLPALPALDGSGGASVGGTQVGKRRTGIETRIGRKIVGEGY